jgi:hypothetical protein
MLAAVSVVGHDELTTEADNVLVPSEGFVVADDAKAPTTKNAAPERSDRFNGF